MIWKCIDSPKRKKFKAVDCVHKIVATYSLDGRDVLLDFLSGGETIIAAGYCSMLDGLKEVEKLKKVAMLAQPWCHHHPRQCDTLHSLDD